jgi:hypothetical protein
MAVELNRATESGVVKPNCKQPSVFSVPEHVRTTHGSDGGTVLNILTGQLFHLNVVGSRILELLKQGLTAPEIAQELAREFEISCTTAEADVHAFTESLEKHHLLTTQHNGTPA